MLIVEREKEWAGVEGILVAIGEEKITFRLQDGNQETDRQTDRKNVRAIRLALVAPAGTGPTGRLITLDGSEVGYASLTLNGDTVVLKTAELGELKIPAQERGGNPHCLVAGGLSGGLDAVGGPGARFL